MRSVTVLQQKQGSLTAKLMTRDLIEVVGLCGVVVCGVVVVMMMMMMCVPVWSVSVS